MAQGAIWTPSCVPTHDTIRCVMRDRRPACSQLLAGRNALASLRSAERESQRTQYSAKHTTFRSGRSLSYCRALPSETPLPSSGDFFLFKGVRQPLISCYELCKLAVLKVPDARPLFNAPFECIRIQLQRVFQIKRMNDCTFGHKCKKVRDGFEG